MNLEEKYEALKAEHERWAEIFGKACVRALQLDYDDINRVARELPLEWNTDGRPRLASEFLPPNPKHMTRLEQQGWTRHEESGRTYYTRDSHRHYNGKLMEYTQEEMETLEGMEFNYAEW